MILTELRKVIPSFLTRVDRPDRGGAYSEYLTVNRRNMEELADKLLAEEEAATPPHERELDATTTVRLIDYDPDAEDKLVAAMLYPYTSISETRIRSRVERMTVDEKLDVVRTYAGDRSGNRRHRPGRALEAISYRFDVLSDYGAFRDLQRHRLLTIEWQDLSTAHGFTMPPAVAATGGQSRYEASMERSDSLYRALVRRLPPQAPYAVALAFRVRYVMQMNAREAMHLIELRTGPQGHPEYRRVAQGMHQLIAEEAGHRVVAELMRFVDYEDYEEGALERLAGERRAEGRRLATSRRAAPRHD
jgi:hypothetical protein